MWSNTQRGAQFLEGSIPRLIRALERIASALEKQNQGDEYLRGLQRAFDLIGGRSIELAEEIDRHRKGSFYGE
jgi:hypothetical protein